MDKIKITICAGTTCYLMGSAYLQSLEDHLEPDIREMVEIEGVRCLGLCKGENYGKAPYVKINGEIISEATLPVVLGRIEMLARGEGE